MHCAIKFPELVAITLPIPGFVSIVCLAVFGLPGDGVQLAPGLSFSQVQLALPFFRELLVGNKFFHKQSSLWFLKSVYHIFSFMHKRFVNSLFCDMM